MIRGETFTLTFKSITSTAMHGTNDVKQIHNIELIKCENLDTGDRTKIPIHIASDYSPLVVYNIKNVAQRSSNY